MNSESPAKRKCLRADCENDAGALQCPTCLKFGIKDSFFCSQDCFKLAWVSPTPLAEADQCSKPVHLPNFLLSICNLYLTLCRVITRSYIKQRVISLAISLPPKLSLNPIQTPVFTTLSPIFHTPVLSALYTHYQNIEKSPKRYNIPIIGRMAYQEANRRSEGGIRSKS
jgi:hypothetical protein